MNAERFGPWHADGKWFIGLASPLGQTSLCLGHEPSDEDWTELALMHAKHEAAESALLRQYRAALA